MNQKFEAIPYKDWLEKNKDIQEASTFYVQYAGGNIKTVNFWPGWYYQDSIGRFPNNENVTHVLSAVEEVDKWISVDTPPEKSGYYTVYDPNIQAPNADVKIETYWYSDYNKQWMIGSDQYHPSHWQPLPSAPKQDKTQ